MQVSSRFFLHLVNVLGLGCWGVCFWWMHRISVRQNATLKQLQQQAHRIEKVSQEEHAILNDLHPNVAAIQQKVGEVSDKVTRVEGTVDSQRSTPS